MYEKQHAIQQVLNVAKDLETEKCKAILIALRPEDGMADFTVSFMNMDTEEGLMLLAKAVSIFVEDSDEEEIH